MEEGIGVFVNVFLCVTLSISNCTKFICVHVFMHVTLPNFNIVGRQFNVVQWMRNNLVAVMCTNKTQIENCVL